MKESSYHRSRVSHQFLKLVKELRKFEWKYKNLILLIVSILIAWLVLKSPSVYTLIQNLESFGYVGAFVTGMMFTYALTVAPATAIIFVLGETLNPILLALVGAVGSVISDYFIFRFVRNRLMDEIKLLSKEINHFTKPISEKIIKERVRILIWKKISRSKIWKTLVPIFAGFIIASPLPDELGVAIFGAVKYEPRKFLLISYILNFIGILIIASIGNMLV